MRNMLWEQYERCAELCNEYLEVFGEHVPMDLICFNSFETISEELEKMIKQKKGE